MNIHVLVDSFACFSSLQLFVGLSFPYEGPAPLEAIANGCAFLNPKFNPPKSSKNTDFFKGKPTLREVRWGGPWCHQVLETHKLYLIWLEVQLQLK